jgi:hypothetical protein
MQNDNIEYRAEFSSVLPSMLFMNGFAIFVMFLSRRKFYWEVALAVLCILNISYLSSLFYGPFKIILRRNERLIEIHYYLPFLRKPKIVSLSDAQISFDYEVRARGMKGMVFRLKKQDESILHMLVDHHGWSRNQLSEMFEQFKQLMNVSSN